jgi:hypothetical protein
VKKFSVNQNLLIVKINQEFYHWLKETLQVKKEIHFTVFDGKRYKKTKYSPYLQHVKIGSEYTTTRILKGKNWKFEMMKTLRMCNKDSFGKYVELVSQEQILTLHGSVDEVTMTLLNMPSEYLQGLTLKEN